MMGALNESLCCGVQPELEILVATVGQRDATLIDRMNLRSRAMIVNQADRCERELVEVQKGRVEVLTLPDRGVGLNRNIGLMRSTAELCLFSDDDVTYVDGVDEVVVGWFKAIPQADVLVFNLTGIGSDRAVKQVKKLRRLRIFNALGYGACRLAVRRSRVIDHNVTFSLLFGGGAAYGAGEDSLFIADCLRAGLRVYAVPVSIGTVCMSESSWFEGYTARFFFDKGVFFAYLSPRLAFPYCIAFAVKRAALFKHAMNPLECLGALFRGAWSGRRTLRGRRSARGWREAY